MRKLLWWANLLLVVFAVLALLQSTGSINGAGSAVRIMYLEKAGVLDSTRACEVNPDWCEREKLGRFIAAHYYSGEAYLALVAAIVATLNLSGCRCSANKAANSSD